MQFATDALGLDPADPRPLTVTGGLPSHGGPSSNYMSHSISHLVERLRSRPGTGLVTGVGMHMTKHVAAVWSAEPGLLQPPVDGFPGESLPPIPVLAHGRGPARVAAATVVHHPDGTPSHAIAICDLRGGGRCYARSEADEVIAAVAGGHWVGATAQIGEATLATNSFRIRESMDVATRRA